MINRICYTLAAIGLIAILILPSNAGQPIVSTAQGHDYLGELDIPQAFNIEIGRSLNEKD